MPLKAKINSNAFSTTPASRVEQGMLDRLEPRERDDPDDVLFNHIYGVRTIQLNRPKKLNSLNGSMARKIIPRLLEWEKSDLASVVIIAGAGERAFCAGGDVAALAQDNRENGYRGTQRSKNYFGLEYQLDHLIAAFDKPYIAYMDGITMGGGVGLSVHAPFRIATERTVFAMPETGIGFFPDVGGSFFLPRLDGYTGTYLALTSEQLRGPEVLWAGVATHFLDSSSLQNLTQRLSELTFKDYATLDERCKVVDETIEEFVTGLPPVAEGSGVLGKKRQLIDRCFKFDTVQEILKALHKEAKSSDAVASEWAKHTIETVHSKSPTSLHVTLRAMRLGKKWDMAETFQREYQLAGKFMDHESHPDFVEGVQAKLIKPVRTPRWKPAKIDKVTTAMVDEYFQVGEDVRLNLYKEKTYDQYPYTNYGLPKEAEVQRLLTRGEKRLTEDQVMNAFLQEKNGKQGVAEKLKDVISRKCQTDGEGYLKWSNQ